MNSIMFVCLFVNSLSCLCLLFVLNFVLFCFPGLRENRRHPATYLVHGAKALNNAFRGWTRKEVGKMSFSYLIFTAFLNLKRLS